jgi:hypothetical protein
MKRLIATLALAAVLVGNAMPALAETAPAPATETAPAVETVTSLPEVSIPPDSAFYGLKLFVERLRYFITRDAAERAKTLDTEPLIKALEATDYKGAAPVKFTSDHDLVYGGSYAKFTANLQIPNQTTCRQRPASINLGRN